MEVCVGDSGGVVWDSGSVGDGGRGGRGVCRDGGGVWRRWWRCLG